MGKKDLNFEINILPILDILSVLICFLLLTAVWVQIGTIDTRQAIGDNTTSSSGKNPPSLWISLDPSGNVMLSLRDLTSSSSRDEAQILGRSGRINWEHLKAQIQRLRTRFPDLKTGIIRPHALTPYKDVVKVMDFLKGFQFEGLGISPLG